MRSASDVAEHDKRSHPVRLLAPPHPKKIRHPQKFKFRRSTGTGGWRNSAHFVSVSHESYKTRVSRARSSAHIKVVRFPRTQIPAGPPMKLILLNLSRLLLLRAQSLTPSTPSDPALLTATTSSPSTSTGTAACFWINDIPVRPAASMLIPR